MKYSADPELESIVREHNRKIDSVMNGKKVDTFENDFYELVTDDYAYYEGNNEPARGRAAVSKLGLEWFAAGCTNELITPLEIRRLSDTSAVHVSHYQIDFQKESGNVDHWEGRLLEVLTREPDGKWRTVLHFYSPKT